MSQYQRSRWTAETGFPGGPVYAIAQSADGYLWVAAERGLVRFDGIRFQLIHPYDSASGLDTTAISLAPRAADGLWAQLRRGAFVRYRNGTFDHVLRTADHPTSMVTAVAPGRHRTMLVADVTRGLVRVADDRMDVLVRSTAMPSSHVISIAETEGGAIMLGTRDAGVFLVNDARAAPIRMSLPDRKINALLAQDRSRLWIATDNGVTRWNVDATPRADRSALRGVAALAMIKDRDENLWIATASKTLVRLDTHGVASSDDLAPSVNGEVTTMFEDREGDLWIGATTGIERWRDGAFTTYSAKQNIALEAGAVLVADDRTWFAPASGGLFWLRDGHVSRLNDRGITPDVVYSIAGSGHDVWLGLQRGGLEHVHLTGSDSMTVQHFTARDGLAQDNVYAIHRSRDGAIWAGTLSGGLSRLKDGVFTTYTTAHGLASNTIASITESFDGRMWFATPSGISVLSPSGWQLYSTTDGLPSNDVNTLFEDSARNLWVGTSGGLALIRGGHVDPSFRAPPALRGAIVGAAEDSARQLWIATLDRIVRVDRDALSTGSLPDAGVREFGTTDGLPSAEGIKRHRSLVADARGRIWLSLTGGIAMADPVQLVRSAPSALVHIEGIIVDGQTTARHEHVTVPPRHQRLTVPYAGLSLAVPERVTFRYRLDGFDRDWSAPTSARQAEYTNLAPGTYRFRVIASNSDGVWSSAEASMSFTIEPAFWQTATFKIAIALICAAGVWVAYRVRVRQVTKQLNLRFDERLAERTRIAQELHDTLLQGFLGASMQLHVAADRLPGDSPARPQLGRVLELMRRVIDEGRNAVRGLRSPTESATDLADAFRDFSDDFHVDSAADYRVIVEGKTRVINPIIRDEIYRIGREALTNAFRHAGATRIELELEYAARALRMVVRDNGRGIPPQVVEAGAEGHWGLPGMRERAEKIGARFKVWSRATAGTELELTVPGRIAFAREGRRS